MRMYSSSVRFWRTLMVFLAGVPSLITQQQGPSPSSSKIVQEGIAVEFSTEMTTGGSQARSGDDVRFRFRISDSASGSPLQGLRPAAWLDLQRSGQPSDERGCTKKVAAFLGDNLLSVPSVDLNTWYVLAMNEDASISVVNPRFGFGGSQLLAMVFLDSLPRTGR